MRRRERTREQHIAEVCRAFDALSAGAKARMLVDRDLGDLYGAVAWLAAHEAVSKRFNRRG